MEWIGIDGCRGGWLFSLLSAKGHLKILLYHFLQDGLNHLSKATSIAIDMPMGLVSHPNEERICDALIRTELGHPFSSSVFNVPCRQAVYANNYREANNLNREICGKGLSVQSWNIAPKIKELDQYLANYPTLKLTMHESHPELCFKQLKGHSLSHKKKTAEGKEERLTLLNALFPDIKSSFIVFRSLRPKKDVGDDDMIDSMILAHNAQQIAAGNHKQFPADVVLDKNGIGMGVCVFNI